LGQPAASVADEPVRAVVIRLAGLFAPLTLRYPCFAADRPTLPVLAFAGVLLTPMLARHRRVRGV